MAERSLGAGAAQRPHHERHLVLLHVGTEGDGTTGAHLHLGPGLSEGLRRFVGCDARIRAVIEAGGKPVSVGRAFRTVPERTRMAIEERDRGCRVPGCDRSLLAARAPYPPLGGRRSDRHSKSPGVVPAASSPAPPRPFGHTGRCRRPRRHTFTDHRGHRLDSCGRPVPPRQPVEAAARDLGIPAGAWSHPTGERLDPGAVSFHEPAA